MEDQHMHNRSVPFIGPRYWVCIGMASVFGTNCGDFVSRILDLGHVSGLPPLAAFFALILVVECFAPFRTEIFYWLAIVTLRTAATNIGDLTTHDLGIDAWAAAAGLAVLMLVTLIPDMMRASRPVATAEGQHGLPGTDLRYWTTMLLAGALGTVGGDLAADELGLGVACLVFIVAFAVFIALRSLEPLSGKAGYWLAIAAGRTMGTDVGDFLAAGDRLGLGLPRATLLTGAVFAVTVLLWRNHGNPLIVSGNLTEKAA
jgi:uncharacterized membrane-anchored protein